MTNGILPHGRASGPGGTGKNVLRIVTAESVRSVRPGRSTGTRQEMNEMKHTQENTGDREMNGSYTALCNENITGPGAGRGKCPEGTDRQPAVQDVEKTKRPDFFRSNLPAPERGGSG